MNKLRQTFTILLTVAIITATAFSSENAFVFADDTNNADIAAVKAPATGEEDSTSATVNLISIDGVTVPNYDIEVYIDSSKVQKDDLGNIQESDYQNELKESTVDGYTFDISLAKDRLYYLNAWGYNSEGLPYADVIGYINVNGTYDFIRISSQDDYEEVTKNMANGTEFSQELMSRITGKSKTVNVYVGKTNEEYMDTPAAEIIVVDRDDYQVTKGAKFKIVNTETGKGDDYTIESGFIKTKELTPGIIYEIIPDPTTWELTTLTEYETKNQYRFFAIEELDGKYSIVLGGGRFFGPIVGPIIDTPAEGEEEPLEGDIPTDEELAAREAENIKEAIRRHFRMNEIFREIDGKYEQISNLRNQFNNETDQSKKDEIEQQIEELYAQIGALNTEIRELNPIGSPDIGSEVEIEIPLLDPISIRKELVLYALAPLAIDPSDPDQATPDPDKPTLGKKDPSDPIPSMSVVPTQGTASPTPVALVQTGDINNFTTYGLAGAIAIIALLALRMGKKKEN